MMKISCISSKTINPQPDKQRVVLEGKEKRNEMRGVNLQFRFRGSPLCKWIMVLQRLAGFLGWWVRTGYVATAEGQFINCQTPGSMRELRLGRDRGELARATCALKWREPRGRPTRNNGNYLLFRSVRLPFPRTSFLSSRRPFVYAHPSLDTRSSIQGYLTLCWLGRFRRGNNRAGYPTLWKLS